MFNYNNVIKNIYNGAWADHYITLVVFTPCQSVTTLEFPSEALSAQLVIISIVTIPTHIKIHADNEVYIGVPPPTPPTPPTHAHAPNYNYYIQCCNYDRNISTTMAHYITKQCTGTRNQSLPIYYSVVYNRISQQGQLINVMLYQVHVISHHSTITINRSITNDHPTGHICQTG